MMTRNQQFISLIIEAMTLTGFEIASLEAFQRLDLPSQMLVMKTVESYTLFLKYSHSIPRNYERIPL